MSGLWDRNRHDSERGPLARLARTMLRRLAVLSSSAGLWQVEGYTPADRDNAVEAFQGVGFASRPRSSATAEAVVVKIGGASEHQVIVAARDFEIEPDLAEDEVAIFNSTGAIVRITKDGDIVVEPAAGREVLVRSSGGSAEALAMKSDVQALADWAAAHRHDAAQATAGSLPTSIPTSTAPGAIVGTPDAPSDPSGTSVLKGE